MVSEDRAVRGAVMSDAAKVHIVDDDDLVREAVEALVSSVGLPAETYRSAADFLERLSSSVQGCVIVDMRMPGMSGIDLQERLVEQGFDIPVIVMSAYGDVSSAVRAMKAGAVDFIEKPYNSQTLLDLIQSSLARDAASRRDRSAEEAIGLYIDWCHPSPEGHRLIAEQLARWIER